MKLTILTENCAGSGFFAEHGLSYLNKHEGERILFDSDQPDFVVDDSAIAVIQNNELIIITACSHAGICNIIKYAIKVMCISVIKTVIGGFHLKENNQQTKQTINFLKEKSIHKIYRSDFTELPMLVAFYEEFNTEQLKTGMILNF